MLAIHTVKDDHLLFKGSQMHLKCELYFTDHLITRGIFVFLFAGRALNKGSVDQGFLYPLLVYRIFSTFFICGTYENLDVYQDWSPTQD